MKTLLAHGYLHGDTLTVTGQTLAQACAAAPDADGQVIRAADHPIALTGGVIVIKGNLAPDGALIKVAGLNSLLHEGPARVFESEEDAMAVIRARAYQAGDVLIIRNEGPKGGPGILREMLGPTPR